MKHILPLTYKPKIDDVREGRCNQTIRVLSWTKPKRRGDWVMFHGWSGKPYRSTWGWRTPYFLITEVLDVVLYEEAVFWIDDECQHIPLVEKDDLAVRDGFKDYDMMYQVFYEMYGDALKDYLDTLYFQVIRWDFDKVLKNKGELKKNCSENIIKSDKVKN